MAATYKAANRLLNAAGLFGLALVLVLIFGSSVRGGVYSEIPGPGMTMWDFAYQVLLSVPGIVIALAILLWMLAKAILAVLDYMARRENPEVQLRRDLAEQLKEARAIERQLREQRREDDMRHTRALIFQRGVQKVIDHALTEYPKLRPFYEKELLRIEERIERFNRQHAATRGREEGNV
jgi:hypothetical protein